MTPDRWKRIEELFHAARALPPDAHLAFLADACPDDHAMQHEVGVLLKDSASDDGFFAAGGIACAAQVAGTPVTAMVGRSLGGYSLQALLGAGGMGEVYRARDIKLGRDVAIKVVPAAFAQDADRMARFAREAQVLASLNHPNIAVIHGLEDRAIVMELVEGPTLADRLRAGHCRWKKR